MDGPFEEAAPGAAGGHPRALLTCENTHYLCRQALLICTPVGLIPHEA